MSNRVDSVREIKEEFMKVKRAFLQVPPHPSFGPPPGDPSQMPPGAPPPGGPADPSQMPPGAPPPGGPVDPAQMQGAPPADPSQMQPAPPAVPTEMAAIMDQVVTKMEEISQANKEREQIYEQRISKLEQQLEHDRAIKEERRKVIDALVPANL